MSDFMTDVLRKFASKRRRFDTTEFVTLPPAFAAQSCKRSSAE
jgi:hypothetical protein